MPEIVFKGKEYVYNHHLTVPYRPLVADAAKGIGTPDLAGNLVIHGDNLHALKSLLPRYAGAVDLIFIDPPYNTGNEGWCYSDGVNSPIMKEWLSTNPVDGEDMLRHDKWLCMMWPRLVLLRELLSERGSIWITLDDNEVHRARMVLDELFGEGNHVATVIWEKADSPKMDAEGFSTRHDTMLVYAQDLDAMTIHRLVGDENDVAPHYDQRDADGRLFYRKPLRAMGGDDRREDRPSLFYKMGAPDGSSILPKRPDGSDGRWRWSEKRVIDQAARIDWRQTDAGWVPYFRIYADTGRGLPPETIFYNTDAGSSRSAATELKQMMGDNVGFATPKPTRLIERVLEIGANPDALILDSFAGSGTTAHAVLKANAKDGGTRRFVLVEGEGYADSLTAERVRRAIKGYAWSGTQRETLLEEKITLTQFKKAHEWLAKVDAIKRAEGLSDDDGAAQAALTGAPARRKRFDKIEAKIDEGVLRVEGVRKVSQRAEGLGGEFTYCTLGEAVDLEQLLSGEKLPTFEALGAWLFYTATGGTLPPTPKGAPTHYLGEALDKHVWLIYRPELVYLKSPDAALTLSAAQAMQAWGLAHDAQRERAPKGHLVFAPAKYLSNKQLKDCGVDYAPLPFALYRVA
ncbi:MAG: site-specific DNA-methyltransferase [Vitreoscilla sp.]|nr:site-specific DNA-methyltransferase [Vitreoscilla sp.]